jgi:hypothetical protein
MLIGSLSELLITHVIDADLVQLVGQRENNFLIYHDVEAENIL